MPAIDTLKLARTLRDKGGFEEPAAEATVEVLSTVFDAIHADMATKHDLQLLRAELVNLEHWLLIRLGGLVIAVATILFAALRYLPSPGSG
jgi:hypothetical protein